MQDAQNDRPARPQRAITYHFTKGGWEMIPTARVQRGLSQAARCASTGIVPATPPPFSASRLDIWNLPINPTQPGIDQISVDVRKTPAAEKLSD